MDGDGGGELDDDINKSYWLTRLPFGEELVVLSSETPEDLRMHRMKDSVIYTEREKDKFRTFYQACSGAYVWRSRASKTTTGNSL